MSYEGDLQRVIRELFYQRGRVSSDDEDVLRLFSGDERAAKQGLVDFHESQNGSEIVTEGPVVSVTHTGKHRFREERWPKNRPSRNEKEGF